MFDWARPYWIVTGLASCAGAVFLFRVMTRQRQRRMQAFASAHLLERLTGKVSPSRRLLKKGLWLTALFCCFLALARPQYGFMMVDVKRKGIDILFALDSSKSMLTEDIRPNRLERAKLAILDFTGRLEGDRVGLIPFAGTAFLSCPLTIDYNAFADSLTSVTTSTIPRGGTDLAAAIALAETTLADSGNHKILALLTDGESLEGDTLAAARQAAQNGMTIFTVGVGTSEGELIPLTGSGKAGQFVRDEKGELVSSRLDEKTLTAIAEATGGLFVPLGHNGEGLDRLYQQKLSLLPQQEIMEKQHKQAVERFSFPLAAALILLVAEFIITSRRRERSAGRPIIPTAGRRLRTVRGRSLLLLLVAGAAAGSEPVMASPGEEAWAAGDFLTAQEIYEKALQERPDDPRLHYNAGATAYKNNLFDDAILSFQRALQSDDLHLQEQSYYNLGNALFKKGEENPQQAEQLWQQAQDAFDGSLKLNPQAKQAQENRALVAARLAELQKQQEQQRKEKEQGQQGQKEEEGQQGQQEQKEDSQAGKKNDQSPGGEGEKKEQEQQQSASNQQQQEGQQPPEPSAGQGQEGKGQGGKDQEEKDQNNAGESATSSPAPDASAQQKDAPPSAPTEATAPEPDPLASPPEPPPEGQENQGLTAQSDEKKQGDEKEKSGPGSLSAVPGKMTPEEARQLVHRLKAVEGRLNFVPQTANGKGDKEGTWKDW